MPDLTFGEQVKIVLSRKGMTIKELAEIIEKRTGKKMSRQNLTQRLGRDNFQEQDMRMIAEILECPFSLSILLEGEEAETVQAGDKQDKLDAQPKSSGQSKPQPTTKESVRIAKAKARKEKKAKEAERLAEAMERVPSEICREPVEKEMTLGDYIDIHEELARQETERLPKMSKGGAETAQENRKQPGAGGQAESGKAETQEAKERPEYGKAETQEVEERPEDGKTEMQEAEERPEDGKAETQEAKGQPENGKGEAQEAGKAEEQGSGEEPEAAEDNAEPKVDVEELLREMEELENERRLLEQQVKEAKEAREAMEQEEHAREEKKITGWRAMFQRRSKKERHEERREEQEIVEQVVLREPAVEELEDDYIEYDEPDMELETDESGTQEENEGQSDTEDIIEELMEEEEDAEDLSRGELNPYTGHEYETNSVRMHPKRIGYVQLYDRRDHGWTDMTEWAFLGYQERKKALLGKDYDPPIYLD